MTGLRHGELLGLMWEDFQGGCLLSVTHSLQRINGGLKLVDTKTEEAGARFSCQSSPQRPFPLTVSRKKRNARGREAVGRSLV